MSQAVIGAIGAGALLLGLAIASVGLYGMLRRPAIFEQTHAAALVTGPGVIVVLLASLASASAEIATSGLLVAAFVLVTSSISTHAIALAAWRRRAPEGAGARTDSKVTGATDLTAMRVIVGHDGSPGANVATSLAASLPLPQGSLIRIVGAVEGDLEPVSGLERSADPSRNLAVELADELDAAVRTVRRPGVGADHVIRRGEPAAAIAREAEAFGADLVVIGSRGFGPLRSLLAGSVAAGVVDSAPCPVLIARVPRVHQVLLATDGSGPSDAAADLVARWSIFDEVPIRVLSVATDVAQYGDLPAGRAMGDRAQAARQQKVADATAMRLRAAGRNALPYVRTGDAVAGIVAYAQAEGIDLIVLGSRGRTGLTRAVLGSVARGVVSSAESSVLVVRAVDR